MTSDRTASRLNRILAMLPYVIAHRGVTVDEVCERFGYNRSDLAADLDLVFVCGLPGYGPGDLIVAYIDGEEVVVDTAEYFADAPRLTPAEAMSLLASGMAVLASGQSSEPLERAVDKLAKVLLPEGNVIDVDLEAEPEMVAKLRMAAARRHAVEIVYTSIGREVTTTRVVEPWKVVSALGNWYLTGFCRSADAGRVFRVDRIRRLHETEEEFTLPSPIPDPEIRYVPAEDDIRCVIEVGSGARWVADYYPVEVLEDDGSLMRFEFSAPDPGVAANLLLRLGSAGRLVSGIEVGEALTSLRGRLLGVYRPTHVETKND
jgi:proteasome accessory factor C